MANARQRNFVRCETAWLVLRYVKQIHYCCGVEIWRPQQLHARRRAGKFQSERIFIGSGYSRLMELKICDSEVFSVMPVERFRPRDGMIRHHQNFGYVGGPHNAICIGRSARRAEARYFPKAIPVIANPSPVGRTVLT